MHDLDINSTKEQRKFGVLMAVAFCVIALIRWWLRGAPSTVLFGIAGTFLVFGLIMPFALKPVFYLWMRFAVVLNRVMTFLLLVLSFFGMITPVRVILSVLGKDPMDQNLEPGKASYWKGPEHQPTDLDQYKNQF